MKEEIRKDLFWFNNKAMPRGLRFVTLFCKSLFSPSFFSIFLYRLARKIKCMPIVPTLLFKLNQFLFAIEIPASANIGGGLRLPHARNIIIAADSILGEFVTIGQQSTIGGNMGYRVENRAVPTIGDWCWICANCVVAGPITIGQDVLVGSHTVLTKNTPPPFCCEFLFKNSYS